MYRIHVLEKNPTIYIMVRGLTLIISKNYSLIQSTGGEIQQFSKNSQIFKIDLYLLPQIESDKSIVKFGIFMEFWP